MLKTPYVCAIIGGYAMTPTEHKIRFQYRPRSRFQTQSTVWMGFNDIRKWTWVAMEAVIPNITIKNLFPVFHRLGRQSHTFKDIGRENVLIIVPHSAK